MSRAHDDHATDARKPAIVSCRVLHLADHGWVWRGVTLTGEVMIVPLRRQSAERMREWLLIDRALNGRPRFAGRVRLRLWILRAAIIGVPPIEAEQPRRPERAKPVLFSASFERDALHGWSRQLSTSEGPRAYPVRSIPAGKLRRWMAKVDQLHGRPPLAEWLVCWCWVVRNWALRGV